MKPNTSECDDDSNNSESTLKNVYSYFYILLFIPGLLLNIIALWVLCKHLRKKAKGAIFMINLALADLVQILSFPLRIFYYVTQTWPFGKTICLICFYLRYFNMYAAIVFLMCISVQRYHFLLYPLSARSWRHRYGLVISITVWVVVGVACSPFILMRSSSSAASNTTGTSNSRNDTSNASCFNDLPTRKVGSHLTIILMVFNEVFGFVIPLICIGYCSIRLAWSLNQKENEEQQSAASLGPTSRSRLQSVTSNGQVDKSNEKNVTNEKRRALRMVLSCFALFLFCFAPYHINFPIYLMAWQQNPTMFHCTTKMAVKKFHLVSLCLASLSCCLNPLLYYFLNAEFRMHLRRTSSFSSSGVSSPINSPTQCTTQTRLMRMESASSER